MDLFCLCVGRLVCAAGALAILIVGYWWVFDRLRACLDSAGDFWAFAWQRNQERIARRHDRNRA